MLHVFHKFLRHLCFEDDASSEKKITKTKIFIAILVKFIFKLNKYLN